MCVLSPRWIKCLETVMDRASAEKDDVIKKRINRGERASAPPFLA